MSHTHLHHTPAALPTRSDSPDGSSHIEQEYDIIFSASVDPESGQPVPLASGSEVLEILSGEYGAQDLEDDPHEEGMFPAPPISDADEDSPDPFVVEYGREPHAPTWQEVPHYLLVIYAIVSWLHLQFNLPRVACNALLAFLASLLTFLNPGIVPPFITLQSAMRTLSVDSRIQWLAVCPKCRDVYPSALSKYAQDTCTNCKVPLFLPDHTRRGSLRTAKHPIIKYPYLPLSAQIESLLKVPGVEALLDEWRKRPRNIGEYGDIFDGEVCRLKLRAPDGSLFFTNLPHEMNGPRGELRIGVNLGIDWYV